MIKETGSILLNKFKPWFTRHYFNLIILSTSHYIELNERGKGFAFEILHIKISAISYDKGS